MADLNLLALDVGERRIGVAVARAGVRIASPLTTIEHAADCAQTIQGLVAQNDAGTLIVGLPRGLNGQETAQTANVRQFVGQLQPHLNVPIVFQDETLTSHKAEAELEARGKPYSKGDIDALAATYILEDYLEELRVRGMRHESRTNR